MEIEEIIERKKCIDPRVFNAIQKAKQADKSFTDRGFMNIFPPTYKQYEVRKIWFDAIALGMNEGLRMGSIEGQRIDLTRNCKEPRQMEFLDKFYKLAEDYNCAIVFHPDEGMVVMDLNR